METIKIGREKKEKNLLVFQSKDEKYTRKADVAQLFVSIMQLPKWFYLQPEAFLLAYHICVSFA